MSYDLFDCEFVIDIQLENQFDNFRFSFVYDEPSPVLSSASLLAGYRFVSIAKSDRSVHDSCEEEAFLRRANVVPVNTNRELVDQGVYLKKGLPLRAFGCVDP